MYTETQVNILKSKGTISFDEAQVFADQNGLSVRSVIAKAKSLGLTYIPKARPIAQPKGRSKAEVIASIEAILKVSTPSLSKANLNDLETLWITLKN